MGQPFPLRWIWWIWWIWWVSPSPEVVTDLHVGALKELEHVRVAAREAAVLVVHDEALVAAAHVLLDDDDTARLQARAGPFKHGVYIGIGEVHEAPLDPDAVIPDRRYGGSV